MKDGNTTKLHCFTERARKFIAEKKLMGVQEIMNKEF